MKQAIYYLMIIGLILGMIPQVCGEYGSIETWNTGSNDIVIHVYDAKTGVDLTGATCTIDILNTTFTSLVNDASMTDSGNGWYNYTYVQMVAGVYNSRIKCTLGTNGSATTSSFKLVDNSLDGLLTGQTTISTDLNNTAQYKATGFSTHSAEDVDTQLNLSHGIGAWTTGGEADNEQLSIDINDTRNQLVQVSTDVNNTQDYVDTEVAGIKTETDKIPGIITSQATMSGDLNTTEAYVDTEVQSILDKTNRILITSEIRDAKVNDASATTTKFITNLTEGTNNFWNRGVVLFTSGGNEGQIRAIKNYLGVTKQITLRTPLNNSPVDGDEFSIVNSRKYLLPDVDDIFIAIDQNQSETVDNVTSSIPDLVWDEILSGSTHNIVTSAGKRLREVSGYVLHSGTAQGGNRYSITLATDAASNDRVYNRNLIVIVDGTGVGQTRTVVCYNGTTKVAMIDREWHISPDATSEYHIVAADTPLVVNHGIAQGGTSTSITLHGNSSIIDDTYRGSIINIMASTGQGEARIITAYSGTTKLATVTPAWTTNPDSTSIYVIMPYGQSMICDLCDHPLEIIINGTEGRLNISQPGNWSAQGGGTASVNNSAIADAIWDETVSEHTIIGSFGKLISDTYTYVYDVYRQIIEGW